MVNHFFNLVPKRIWYMKQSHIVCYNSLNIKLDKDFSSDFRDRYFTYLPWILIQTLSLRWFNCLLLSSNHRWHFKIFSCPYIFWNAEVVVDYYLIIVGVFVLQYISDISDLLMSITWRNIFPYSIEISLSHKKKTSTNKMCRMLNGSRHLNSMNFVNLIEKILNTKNKKIRK